MSEDDSHLHAFHMRKGTILDSSTMDTYLPKALASALDDAWEEIMGWPFNEIF